MKCSLQQTVMILQYYVSWDDSVTVLLQLILSKFCKLERIVIIC